MPSSRVRRGDGPGKLLYAVAGAVVGGFIIWAVLFIGPAAIAPTAPTTPTAETEFSFAVYDRARSSNGDLVALDSIDDYGNPNAAIDVWEVDISSLTSEQIEELTFADFSAKKSGNAEAVTWTPEAGFFYLANISSTGMSEVWYHYTDSTPMFVNGMSTLQLGTNNVFLLNQSATANFMVYNSTLGIDISASYDDDYTCLFSFETNDEGLSQDYDPSADAWSYIGIAVEFNETATTSWVRTPTNEIDPIEKEVSENTTYLWFSGDFWGKTNPNDISLHLTGTPGTDYTLVGISLVWGYVGSVTTYVTQT